MTAPGCQMVTDASTPPRTICGVLHTGRRLGRRRTDPLPAEPVATPSQVVTAMGRDRAPRQGRRLRADRPVAALPVARPRVGAPATAVASQPPTATAADLDAATLGQLCTRQTLFKGRAQARLPLDLSCRAGRFELQLLTPLASACSPVSQQGGRCHRSARRQGLLSLSIRVTAGRYTAEVQCRGARTRPVLARRHRDVPSRLSLEVRELSRSRASKRLPPGRFCSYTREDEAESCWAILATLELGGGAAGAIQPDDDPVWREQVAAEDRATAGVETTTGDPGTIIAIVDTGVNPDSRPRGRARPRLRLHRQRPRITGCRQSPGTRVASVIAARGNNGVGMAGHCWKCRIMPVRVSENGTTTPAGIATGIVYAVDHGAKIINVSFAHRNYDSGEADAVRYAAERGAIVVASAGNTGNDVPQYPAAYPACSRSARRTWRTRSTGRAAGTKVLLTAPGCARGRRPRYRPARFAASFTPSAVAGVLGLLWSRNPILSRRCCRPCSGPRRFLVASGDRSRQRSGGSACRSGRTRGSPADPAPRPAPGQRFTRGPSSRRAVQAWFPLDVSGSGGGASSCSCCNAALRRVLPVSQQGGRLTVAAPAVKNLISLSIRVTAGRYTAEVQCRGARTRQYSLGVIAMFPRGFP